MPESPVEDKCEDKREKIRFLEKILELARENPRVVGRGRTVFVDSYPRAFDEGCYITVQVNRKGKAFFKYGSKEGQEGVAQDYYNADEILEAAQRYLPKSFSEFKKEFHLYDTRTKSKKPNKEGRRKAVDLLDKIR